MSRIGQIILIGNTVAMAEIVACSALLDLALAVRLDMEGGQVGRHFHFKPSKLVTVR